MNSRRFSFAARSLAIAGVACASVALAMLPKAAFAETADKDPLVARVNGVEVRQSDLTLAREDLGRSIPEELDEAKTREYLIRYVADLIVLSDTAKKQKIGEESDLRQRAEFARNKALRDKLLSATGRDAATETAVRDAFDEAVRQATADPQLRIRAIVFQFAPGADASTISAAETKANAALDRIRNGEDFAAVARETSENFSGKLGGDMGFIGRGQMGKEYADVAYALKDGEFSSSLIRTSFGWHIIKVEGRRDAPKLEFDAVRDRFEEYVVRRAQVQLMSKLHATMKIERIDQSPNSVETGAKTKAN